MVNLLITSPFKKHGVVEGFLRDLDTRKHDIVIYNYSESPERDYTEFGGFTEYMSSVSEAGNPGLSLGAHEARHRAELEDIMDRHDTRLVIPTSEKFLSLVANNPDLFSGRAYVPTKAVLDMNFDKLRTYGFYGNRGLPVPASISVDPRNPEGLEDFIKEHGVVFMKPSVSTSGLGTRRVESMDDFYDTYHAMKDELVASELLHLPEHTHTMLVEDGRVRGSATYVGPGSIGFSTKGYLERHVVRVPQIAELGEAVVDALREEFGAENINGAYNVDFLTRGPGEYVLSEVNAGRLPGSHSTITRSGYNIAADYVNAGVEATSSISA